MDVQINHFTDSIPKKGRLSVMVCEIIFLKNDSFTIAILNEL